MGGFGLVVELPWGGYATNGALLSSKVIGSYKDPTMVLPQVQSIKIPEGRGKQS